MATAFGANETPNHNDCSESYNGYLKRAADACEAGDLVLGMHLYLAAYEKAVIDPAIPDGMGLAGLREAWHLACDLKERSLAEYVFEKLEPYLTGDEIANCAQMLQNLALDRLEQYGFSREDLENMAQLVSQDFTGDGSVVKVESITIPNVGILGASATPSAGENPTTPMRGGASPASNGADQSSALPAPSSDIAEPTSTPSDAGNDAAANTAYTHRIEAAMPNWDDPTTGRTSGMPEELVPKQEKPNHVGMSSAPADDFNPYDEYRDYSIGKSYYAATNEGSGAHVFTRDLDRAEAGEKAKAESEAKQQEQQLDAERFAKQLAEQLAQKINGQANAEQPDQQAETEQQDPDKPVAAQNVAEAIGGMFLAGSMPASLEPIPSQDAQLQAPPAQAAQQAPKQASAQTGVSAFDMEPVLSYQNLVGYDEIISIMRDFGIGLQHNDQFISLISSLNSQHGLDRAPAMDTLLFRAPTIEDANRFVEATIGEIGLPSLRMSMEEGMQGMPVLCVTTQGNNRPRMNHAHNRFEAPAMLVIEDLDSWVLPTVPETAEGMNAFIMANISRGAREAVSMIRSAVEDPDVFVLATATTTGEPDPFFYDMLEPMTVVEIGFPNDKERIDIWTEIAQNHPSMRAINRQKLMAFSEGLSRYDIYIAAREAIEEAYKTGLVQRRYVPVTPYNIYEKLSACHPLDSETYHAIEEEIMQSFHEELEQLEDYFDSSES
ncbi:MAG: hypothetical protein IJH88_05670 [Eggerthellaceae bacterium]|nr:hypothetical protein [Eggerthellaceae bacterium]